MSPCILVLARRPRPTLRRRNGFPLTTIRFPEAVPSTRLALPEKGTLKLLFPTATTLVALLIRNILPIGDVLELVR